MHQGGTAGCDGVEVEWAYRVSQNSLCCGVPNAIHILQGVLNPLCIGDLHPSHTSSLYSQWRSAKRGLQKSRIGSCSLKVLSSMIVSHRHVQPRQQKGAIHHTKMTVQAVERPVTGCT